MYAKLQNGRLIAAPKSLPGDGVVVYNPPDDMYRASGYKRVEYSPSPEAPDGYIYEVGWEERDDAIVEVWTLVKLPDELDDAEALAIILGGGDA